MGGVGGGPPVVVRPAAVGDMPGVGEILVEGFTTKFRTIFGGRVDQAPCVVAQIERVRLERDLCVLFVAEMSEEIVGFIELATGRERLSALWRQLQITLHGVGLLHTLRATVGLALPHETTRSGTAYINTIAVTSRLRGRRIGWSLLESAEGWARRHGRRSLSLHVAGPNPARRLYQRFGFRLENQSGEWLTDWLFGIRTWLYMVKPLLEQDGCAR